DLRVLEDECDRTVAWTALATASACEQAPDEEKADQPPRTCAPEGAAHEPDRMRVAFPRQRSGVGFTHPAGMTTEEAAMVVTALLLTMMNRRRSGSEPA